MTAVANAAADSDTPLRAVFKIHLNGKTVSIATVGQAYRFITNLSSVEWIEFRALHADAVSARRWQCDADRAGDQCAPHALRPRQAALSGPATILTSQRKCY